MNTPSGRPPPLTDAQAAQEVRQFSYAKAIESLEPPRSWKCAISLAVVGSVTFLATNLAVFGAVLIRNSNREMLGGWKALRPFADWVWDHGTLYWICSILLCWGCAIVALVIKSRNPGREYRIWKHLDKTTLILGLVPASPMLLGSVTLGLFGLLTCGVVLVLGLVWLSGAVSSERRKL